MVRGVFLTAPFNVQLMEFDRPELPPEAILAKTIMCGVCGTDVHMYRGTVPIVDPIPLGHEWLGRIEEIGAKAEARDLWGQELKVGDLIIPGWSPQGCRRCVYCKFYMKPYLCVSSRGDPFEKPKPGAFKPSAFSVGGYSDLAYIFPTGWIYKVPEDLPPEIAVLTEPFSTALHVGDYADKEGLVVVVQGSGPIGLLAVMAAKLSGASTTIVIGAPEARLRLCKEFGADYAINIQEVPEREERIRRVKELTRGSAGADLVVEAAGNPEAFVEGLRMTRRDGIYLELGHWTDRGSVPVNPYEICWRNVHIHGLYGYNPDRFEYSMRTLHRYKDSFPLRKVVTHRFPLEKAKEALETAGRWECMKAVIVP